jgi:putative ABC transport system substrate-binding protein
VHIRQLGALVSYSPTDADHDARAAAFVDRILRGASPADLPVEQPSRFALTINLGTAKALGIVIPKPLLLRADELIR